MKILAFLLVIVVALQVGASVIKSEGDGCLPEYFISILRNFTIPHADQIENFTGKVVKRNTIELTWDNPNEHILAFSVFSGVVGSNEKKILCVSYQEFEDGGRKKIIDNLLPGKYEFTVVVRFVAGYGRQSEPIFIEIFDQIEPNYLIYWIISSIALMVLIFSIFLMFETKRSSKKNAKNSQYEIFVYNMNPDDGIELERKNIKILDVIGHGSFHSVFKGALRKTEESEAPLSVAVKTVNDEACCENSINLLKEGSIMKNFDTFHIIKLLGIVSKSKPYFIVMELMTNGDLQTFLRKNRPPANRNEYSPRFLVTIPPVSHMAIQIADGMAYLGQKKFVHRDLAARNCMVSDDFTVKIGDFGLTRNIDEADSYQERQNILLPVRWMSPESLKDGIFTSESDVFSYGIVLWEIVTYAKLPYEGKSNPEALNFIIEGGTESRPDENCSDRVYEIMTKCWRFLPKERIRFKDIIEDLLCEAPVNFTEESFHCPMRDRNCLN